MSDSNTERARLHESQAVDAESLLAEFWRQTPDYAAALTDVDGLIIGWRGAAEKVFGYTEHEAVGQPIGLIFTEEDSKRGMPALERAVASTSGRAEDDRWHVRKDGARIWVSGALIAARRNGLVIGFVKVMRDRTDLKMHMEILRSRGEGAEQALHYRDASLARFVHEIRNSIAPMSNAIRLLARAPGTNEFATGILQRQLAIVERMVADLAEVTRAQTGKLAIQKQLFDVGAALVAIVDTVRERAKETQRQIVTLIPSTPVMVNADPGRLHQIVFNLLDNALKYTDEGGHVWVKCWSEEGGVVIHVEDDGRGIPEELLPVIFDLFTQEAPHRSEGGFGVGLSLVKSLVEAHEGVVEVRSEGRGKGCEFTVRLPAPGEPA